MSARAPGKVALTVPVILLVALLAVYLALHSAAFSISGSHPANAGPAAAPASVQGGTTSSNQQPPGSATVNQSSSGAGAQAPATGAGYPSGPVVSGGPEDAGPDVVTQRSGSRVCAPKICRPS